MSEPLLSCFGCGRTGTLEDLAPFPWWDPHAAAFATMNYCARCRKNARTALEGALRRDERMLGAFHEFARRRGGGAAAAEATIAGALRILDALEDASRVKSLPTDARPLDESATAPLAHGAGAFTVMALAAAFSVYGLGVAEIATPFATLLLGLVFAAVHACACAAGFAVGSRMFRRAATRVRAYVLGSLVGLALAFTLWSADPGFELGLAGALLLSAASVLACSRAARSS